MLQQLLRSATRKKEIKGTKRFQVFQVATPSTRCCLHSAHNSSGFRWILKLVLSYCASNGAEWFNVHSWRNTRWQLAVANWSKLSLKASASFTQERTGKVKELSNCLFSNCAYSLNSFCSLPRSGRRYRKALQAHCKWKYFAINSIGGIISTEKAAAISISGLECYQDVGAEINSQSSF